MNKQSFLDNAYSIYNDNIIYTIADIIYNDIDCNVYINNNLINVIYPSKKIEVIIFINYSVPFKEYVQNYVISKARNGIRCIVVFKHELLNKQIIIRDIIHRALNIHTKNIIYARNTSIIDINTENEKQFINKYHLQGYTPSSVKIGLQYKNEIVSMMTFGKPRMNSAYEYELIRLCSCYDVVGGTEKMFKYFIKRYNPDNILSYCDITKFNGKVYTKLGFSANEDCITTPNYVWYNNETMNVLPRYKTMKHKLVRDGLGTEDETEDLIMIKHGYTKIYNAGNLKFTWSNKKGD